MTIVTRKLPGEINPERCFMLWYELGTLAKAAAVLEKEGLKSPITQRGYTRMSIYNAAMRWVFANVDEAWEYYKKAGTDLTREEWERWLVRTAVNRIYRYSRRGFFRWIARWGFEKYRDVYEPITGRFNYSGEALL